MASGSIIPIETISGTIASTGVIYAQMQMVPTINTYQGEYEVTPVAYEKQTLKTSNLLLEHDVVVNEVPYYETTNDSNGTTVYIAKEAI